MRIASTTSAEKVREAMPPEMRYWADMVRQVFGPQTAMKYLETPTLKAGKDIKP